MNPRTWALGLLVATTTMVSAREAISIQVSPARSFAPANLTIRTSVDLNVDNRAIEIVADSATFYRSSTIQLEGDRAPKTTIVQFRSLPPGEYAVTAAVIGADGRRRAIARRNVNVIDSGSN